MLASKLKAPGMKEYFRGYVYLYSTMKRVHFISPSILSINQVNLAILFFDLAKTYMSEKDPCFLDLSLMTTFLKRKFLTIGYISARFAEVEMSKYSLGARRFLFRAMVVTMYWENKFQPFPLLLLSTHARDMDVQITNGQSYRNALLTACVKVHDAAFFHRRTNNIEDYPPIRVPRDTDVKIYWIKTSTSADFTPVTHFVPGISSSAEPPVILSEDLLKKQKLAEQVYAFGYQIVEASTLA
jgi:hypothetical protein